jgi:hypothetical protein
MLLRIAGMMMARPVVMWNAGRVETNVSGGETARVRGDWEIPWDTIAVAGGNESRLGSTLSQSRPSKAALIVNL